MSNFAMRSAVKAYKADCRMYREKAFDEIDRACNLLTRGDYCGAADALYEAITDAHKAFLMGEIGLTYEKCAGWREEDGERGSRCGKSCDSVWGEDYKFCPYCGRRIENADE